MHRLLAFPLWILILACAVALGCETPAKSTLSSSADEAESPVAARVGSEVITVAQLDERIKDDLFKRETKGGSASRIYELRSQILDQIIAQSAAEQEAARRGVTLEEMLASEFEAQGSIRFEDVQSFYQANVDKLRGASLEQAAPQIRAYLENEKQQRAIQAIVAATEVERNLEVPRVEISATGPSYGPEDARVTIVEFSDFQCPFCRRATPVLREIAARYPEDVRVVYRHLPLDRLHPRARASAEASACAADQGRFWEYHDVVFAHPDALEDADLRRYAEELGLDAERFGACTASREHAAQVAADERDAQAIGVTGTPAFVVNGIILFGLQTAETFDEVIRSELARSEGDSAS